MSRLSLVASSCGESVLQSWVEEPGERPLVGRVIAIHDRSLLIELPSATVSLVEPALGAGPFSIVLKTSDEFQQLKMRTHSGQAVLLDRSGVRSSFSSGVSSGMNSTAWAVELSGATIWNGNVNDYSDCKQSIPTILGRLDQMMDCAPKDALLRSWQPGVSPHATLAAASSPTGQALRPVDQAPRLADQAPRLADQAPRLADQAIESYLINVLNESEGEFLRALEQSGELPHELLGLLGAGRGLTPTGDDVLVGILLSVNMLHSASATRSWLMALSDSTKVLTQPFSAQFVLAAALGCIGEKLNDVFDQIVIARRFNVSETASVTQSIGHSSGWDTLVGLQYVCRTMQLLEQSGRQSNVAPSIGKSGATQSVISESSAKQLEGLSHA